MWLAPSVAAVGRSGHAAPDAPMPDAMEAAISDLAPGVHLIEGLPGDPAPANGGRTGNVIFLVGARGVAVWNAGVSHRHGERIVRAVRSRTSRPIRWLVLERPWRDLLFGANALRANGARIAMHRDAVALMRARCRSCLENLTQQLGAQAMQGSALPEPTDVAGTQDELNALAARITDDIGRDLSWIGLGHASVPGAMATFDRASGVLLSGDTIMTHCVHDWMDADADGLRRALDALERWLPRGAVRQVLAHHGRPQGPSSIARTRRYVDELDATLREQIDRGAGMLEATQAAALPAFANDRDYTVNHPRNVVRRFLAIEQSI